MENYFYLIYDTEEQALLRSEQAGSMRNLSWSINKTGSRFWFPIMVSQEADNPRAAVMLPTTTKSWFDDETLELLSSEVVPVDKDILTEDEMIDMVENLPSDWVYPSFPDTLGNEPEQQRARDANGRFIADDPTTPDEDEAWTQPD